MKFTKMNGAGNDYVYVNLFEEKLENPSKYAKIFSDRHYSIGGDGLILIKKGKEAPFAMEMFNPDGSRGEMCGNAIRCVGKLLYEEGYSTEKELKIETLAGVRSLELGVVGGEVLSVRVNMGIPTLECSKIPVLSKKKSILETPLMTSFGEVTITCVSVGNPHTVLFSEEWNGDLAKEISENSLFPNRTNVEFVNIEDKHSFSMRVYERGTGETLACGTGACAAFFAGNQLKRFEKYAVARLLGGDLMIEYINGELYLTGDAKYNFKGEIDLEYGEDKQKLLKY